MTISELNDKYYNKGGFKLLNEFREEQMTSKYIAEHFGVTKVTIQEWMQDLYGVKYDPRAGRKEKIINSMMKFAKNHTLDEFKDAYYYASRHYYDIVLSECYNQGIYLKEEKSEIQLSGVGTQ
jgi:hypothetical protein